MFIPYQISLRESARTLRKNQTKPEQILWKALRKRAFLGYKFLRQKPLLFYIADFYCCELKLIIEIDGEHHDRQKELDEQRTIELQTCGLRVIRYTNNQISNHLPEVLNNLKDIIQEITKK